jgi:hypothetical protein
MFLGSLMKVSLVMFIDSPRNIRDYVPRCYVVKEHKLCSSALMVWWAYIRPDKFFGYVPRFFDEHNLCSSTINICFSILGRRIFVCFLW